MRVPCYFAAPVPDSRFSMWRFGALTDRHAACPSGITVVVGLDNELYVPEACGRVEVFDPGDADPAVARLLEQAMAAGYQVRKQRSVTGDELPKPDTAVEPFVVNEGSLLAAHPESPIFRLLAGPDRVYEGDDGELYVETPLHR
jgi:hypothetical protein